MSLEEWREIVQDLVECNWNKQIISNQEKVIASMNTEVNLMIDQMEILIQKNEILSSMYDSRGFLISELEREVKIEKRNKNIFLISTVVSVIGGAVLLLIK